MLILVNLAHFWPVFSPLQLWYGQKILRDPVFMSVLVRVKSTTHLCDHNTPELAVKGVFTPKIAKNWIFEGGALKIEQNGGHIWVLRGNKNWNSGVPELNTIFGPIPLFLTLSSLTISYPHSFLTFNHNESSNIPIHNLAFQHCLQIPQPCSLTNGIWSSFRVRYWSLVVHTRAVQSSQIKLQLRDCRPATRADQYRSCGIPQLLQEPQRSRAQQKTRSSWTDDVSTCIKKVTRCTSFRVWPKQMHRSIKKMSIVSLHYRLLL